MGLIFCEISNFIKFKGQKLALGYTLPPLPPIATPRHKLGSDNIPFPMNFRKKLKFLLLIGFGSRLVVFRYRTETGFFSAYSHNKGNRFCQYGTKTIALSFLNHGCHKVWGRGVWLCPYLIRYIKFDAIRSTTHGQSLKLTSPRLVGSIPISRISFCLACRVFKKGLHHWFACWPPSSVFKLPI